MLGLWWVFNWWKRLSIGSIAAVVDVVVGGLFPLLFVSVAVVVAVLDGREAAALFQRTGDLDLERGRQVGDVGA